MSTGVAEARRKVLGTGTLIMLAVLKGCQQARMGKKVKNIDLSKYLLGLKKRGLDISAIAMQRTLEGIWSGDIGKYLSEEEVHHRMYQYLDESIKFGPRDGQDDPAKCFDEHLQMLINQGQEYPEEKPLINKAMRILKLGLFV